MLEAIKRLLSGQATGQAARPQPDRAGESDEQRLRIAACAVLLEIAHADGEFTTEERAHIEAALVRHFDLSTTDARELMALAEERRRGAVDLYQFTSLLTAGYDEGQRLLLAELLWRVVYADGKLSQHEDYLMRRLAHLLDLRPGYLAVARNRAVPSPPESPPASS
jgi:uncharacterized tellurite resistance protein B-like protein